jgi:head-tail adaptor
MSPTRLACHTRSPILKPMLALSTLAITSASGLAQSVLINASTPAANRIISPGQTTIDPDGAGPLPPVPLSTADITVSGTTLTVNGRHTIRNLTVESSGVVTHDFGFTVDYSDGAGADVVNGMWLNVQANPTGGNVTVAGGGRIDASARGFDVLDGPGASNGRNGGSHGGYGGAGNFGGIIGQAYGSVTEPASFGSGGANSRGGGAIRLNVGGTLAVSGAIRADGQSNADGGAGGSILINTGSLTGLGTIAANGGAYTDGSFGAGGGGRVAVNFNSNSFTGALTAVSGASGGRTGGAGTVWTKAASSTLGSLTVANSQAGGRTPLPPELAQVNVLTVTSGGELVADTPLQAQTLSMSNNGVISHSEESTNGLQLFVLGNATIASTSRIDVSSRGFNVVDGPGGSSGRNGGSHGGFGGAGNATGTVGQTYGSVTEPTTLGSGGANSRGGGAIRLSVGGALAVSGAIRADGQSNADGGAGGSIWVSAGSISGLGTISANGGAYTDGSFGAGGGGRVAVYFTTNTFTGVLSAVSGASGGRTGGAGTIWTKASSSPLGSLTITNSQPAGRTPLPADVSEVNVLTLSNGGELVADFPLQAQTLTMSSNGVISHSEESTNGLRLTVLGNATVGATSRIDVTSRGFNFFDGPGGSSGRNGGSHGGFGGGGNVSGTIGQTYGSVSEPITLGSGGANSRGGGAIRLSVGGALSVSGAIRADGQSNADGGAGGSIWITAGSLSGIGTIAANGGVYTDGSFGAGGGGRIALYFATNTFTGVLSALSGASGGRTGGAGTIWTKAASASLGSLTIANSQPAGRTPLPSNVSKVNVLTITNGGELVADFPLQAQTLSMSSSGVLSHSEESVNGLRLSVLGSANIGVGSRIDVTARGFAPQFGPGRSSQRNGGSHGGRGGFGNAGGILGDVYGSATQPVLLGSGGGNSRGGGALRLNVTGNLNVEGAIRADGQANADGGAGGSVWITAGSLSGLGTIAANGGNYTDGSYGGGGGGRVAVYTCVNSLPVSGITANGGAGRPGTPGTVVLDTDGLLVLSQPTTLAACSSINPSFTFDVIGATSFQWTRNGAPLADGPTPSGSVISGSTTSTLRITGGSFDDGGIYRAAASNSCGSITSDPARFVVCPYGTCPADYDASGGTPDTTDIDAFFTDWLTGEECADADCSGGTPDSSDITAFFNAWLAGGC